MRKNDGRIVPNFMMQAISGKPLTIYGDGSQTRSFCHVSDLTDGLILLMNSDIHAPTNLGNPRECTVLELANIIKKICRSNSEIIFKELPEDDPIKRRPDIKKAETELKWHPKIGLEEGLKNALEWFKK